MKRLARIRTTWEQQKLSIPDLSSGLEEIFSELRWDINEEAAQKAFEAWGDIEIYNSHTLRREQAPHAQREEGCRSVRKRIFHHILKPSFRKINYLNKIMRPP